MPYRVKATRSVEEAHEFPDLTKAHNKAAQLKNEGCTNVTILDPQGQDVLDTDEERRFNEG